MRTLEEDALRLLRSSVGDTKATFREGQLEAIVALVRERKRLLVVQCTGWGKSNVYFISAKLLREKGHGPTVIVSPLLALMRNQLQAAARMELKAITINSANTDEWETLQEQVVSGEADVLLISPERLANERFIAEVLLPIAGRIGMLVVDEAHCISDWGHDFRPDYRRIIAILKQLPANLPVLGTTATANQRVVDDLKVQLGDLTIQRGTLVRDSLMLDAVQLPDQAARLAWRTHYLPLLPGSGIVYTLTVRDAERVAEWLQQNGIEARAYHASVVDTEDGDLRERLEQQLLDGSIKALVATTALGMGYDKPDLGFVIHFQAPGSIIGYYQQVGRAGRAIEKAYGILLHGEEDAEIHAYFQENAFPNESNVLQILKTLEGGNGLSIRQLEPTMNLRYGQLEQALKFLSMEDPAPVVLQDHLWKRTPVAYTLDHAHIQRLMELREREREQVVAYVQHTGCRMEFLQQALDDVVHAPCGHCANCLDKHFKADMPPAEVARAATFLRSAEMVLTCPKALPAGGLDALDIKGNIPLELRPQPGRILCRWGDSGWGKLVAQQKHDGHFKDELVHALAEMVNERWCPDPPPMWVTCVPSLRHPELVPDLARRLAAKLELPFHNVVEKTRQNEAQKAMQNRYHQCHNLDGAFAIGTVPEGPVLLVDDVVDSGWTIAILSAQLLQAGCTLVYPIALASTSHT
ncbi:MAG: RecQ family ATP-dependent DNA helicase [Flavobacteriales bacterium]|nr:RecQ family ATP-dependent DNA helicase [Flavobacteriales bacterium]MBK6943904.1 RecQ family ATP-dependent DNA helicase [Flavobacteriales bacterium]MBK7240111.1 RecQ family ATP-dependent DNA helicase [Flavobacteriales bacterium]MBP9136865.1 RecQ family ATP-dependent DNA helicase [Flavobacteriales bacterium]HQV51670.1 RecQ family ATP-dependent DNA helicase [Flavobacteriales bacterium]